MAVGGASGPIPTGTLLRLGLFSAMLASAGLPLYIHLPAFAGSGLGLSLTTLAGVLIAMRLFDLLQDPLIGRAIDRFPRHRPAFAAGASGGLGLGFVMLFAVPPPVAPAAWLVLSLAVLFTAFSTATILVYGQGTALAGRAGEGGGGDAHFGVAGYREAGIVLGILFAAVAPTLLGRLSGAGEAYRLFGLLLGATCLIVWAATRSLWVPSGAQTPPLSRAALRGAGASSLLVFGFLNALPVALTSTLFLFFVEDRLALPDLAGGFLLLFFAAAGLAAPVWARLVPRIGARAVLLAGMALAILAFAGTAALGPGDGGAFALICAASGAALGADMVVLPALFARALARSGLPAGQAFGLWTLASKLALAGAAALALPMLERSGYAPGQPNGTAALDALTFAYAVLPCLLKAGLVGVLILRPSTVDCT